MEKIIAVIAAIGLLVWLYYGIKGNPQVFTKENFGKSFSSMGILALILIAFIAFCILLLRSSG